MIIFYVYQIWKHINAYICMYLVCMYTSLFFRLSLPKIFKICKAKLQILKVEVPLCYIHYLDIFVKIWEVTLLSIRWRHKHLVWKILIPAKIFHQVFSLSLSWKRKSIRLPACYKWNLQLHLLIFKTYQCVQRTPTSPFSIRLTFLSFSRINSGSLPYIYSTNITNVARQG